MESVLLFFKKKREKKEKEEKEGNGKNRYSFCSIDKRSGYKIQKQENLAFIMPGSSHRKLNHR
jgi:hypothetical protein